MQIHERTFLEHRRHFQKCSLDNQLKKLEKHVVSSCQKEYQGRNSRLQAAPCTRYKMMHKNMFSKHCWGRKNSALSRQETFNSSLSFRLIAIAGSISGLFFLSPLCIVFLEPLWLPVFFFTLNTQLCIFARNQKSSRLLSDDCVSVLQIEHWMPSWWWHTVPVHRISVPLVQCWEEILMYT